MWGIFQSSPAFEVLKTLDLLGGTQFQHSLFKTNVAISIALDVHYAIPGWLAVPIWFCQESGKNRSQVMQKGGFTLYYMYAPGA